ncbi:MAG: proline dehydrogenase transcriptional activator [Robiginitomaculum sp.]|nr:MAG: proline dehydrogenase transcriptional activator [Robiginitomaculum sp.]
MKTLLEKLDQQDRRILTHMQKNGRMTTTELAEHVHVSTSAAQKRLRKLEREGYITDYRAHIAPKSVDQAYLVYIQIKLADTQRSTLDKFNEAVRAIPQILACDMLTAGFDYLLKVRCRDMHAFTELHGDVLSSLPGVQQTLSFPVMKEVKDTTALIIE